MQTSSNISRNNPGVSRARQRYNGLPSYRHGVPNYDSSLGRFISADRLFIERPELCVERPLECALYGYADNNPLKNIDRDGNLVCGGFCVAALISGGAALVSGGKELYDDYQKNGEITTGGAVKAGLSGFVSGAKALIHAGAFAVGGPAGTFAATSVTAPMTFVESISKDAIDGKEANMSKALVKTGVSAILDPALSLGGSSLKGLPTESSVKASYSGITNSEVKELLKVELGVKSTEAVVKDGGGSVLETTAEEMLVDDYIDEKMK